MGITIRHDSPAFGAAYASGMAAGQQRRRKYAMDLMQQNGMLGGRLPSTRGSIGGSRAAGGRPGVWQDPLALPSFEITGDMSDRDIELAGRRAQVTQHEAQKGRARKWRLGKPIPTEWQPQFISGEELDRRDELADAERDRRWAVEDREDTQAFEMGKATRDSMQSEFAKLPPIPKHAPPEIREKMQQAREALRSITGQDFDTNREEVLESWNDAWNEYNTLMEGVGDPDPNEGGLVVGADGKLRAPGPGEKATHWRNPNPGEPPIPLDQDKEKKPTVTYNGIEVDADTYMKIYQNSLAQAKAWQDQYWALKDSGKYDDEDGEAKIEERLGPRPTVLPNPLDLMAPPAGAAPAAPPEIPGEAMIGGGIPIAGGRASADVAGARSQGRAEPEQRSVDLPQHSKQNQEQVKAQATQRLEQYGYTYDNYTSAQSTLQKMKREYPNIKSLDELPPKLRKAVAKALMIRDLAEGKK